MMEQEAQKWYSRNKKFVWVVLAVILLFAFASSIPSLSITGTSFNQGTQGLNFNFATIQTPSGSEVAINPQAIDYQASGGPVISGSIGPFTVDTSTTNNRVYTWQIQNGTATDKYQANLVECSMSFDLFESGTGPEAGPAYSSGFSNILVPSPTSYNGYNIWIKITPQQAIPFANNPNEFYIAPAYIGLTSSVNWGIEKVGSSGTGAPAITVAQINGAEETSPMAQGDVFPIYYAIGGASVPLSTTDSFQGQPLSPVLFQNQYYIELNIQKLAAVNSYSILYGSFGHLWAFPTGTFDLTCYVWLVGEWTTYFSPGQLPTQVQHATQFGSSITAFGGIANFLNDLLNPFGNLSWLVWVFVLIVVLLVAYWYLVKRKPKEGEGTGKLQNKYFGISLTNWVILGGLAIVDIFDIEIFPIDILTDIGTLGFLWYIWQRRSKEG